MDDAFSVAFDELIGLEGNYSDDEHDPGNWTGGRVNVGKLVGTHWGISAAAYPTLDIVNLSRDDAKAIYRRDFWNLMKCDALPATVGGALFKIGVNFGPETAVHLLQNGMGIKSDGVMGNQTIATVIGHPLKEVLTNLIGESAYHYAGLPGWETEGRGWMRRAIRTALEAQ